MLKIYGVLARFPINNTAQTDEYTGINHHMLSHLDRLVYLDRLSSSMITD